MKTKALVILASAAAITLSFTFISVVPTEKNEAEMKNLKQKELNSAPSGGFIIEDKL